MIDRKIKSKVLKALQTTPVVALLGPRQIGKTTLAKHFLKESDKDASYLDLDNELDLGKLSLYPVSTSWTDSASLLR